MLPVGYTVLVVEDEPLISMMIEDMVAEMDGGTCACVRTVATALTALTDRKPDLVLLDIDLGTGTSLDVARECRRISVPVIYTTGFPAGDIPVEFGAAPILSKPFGLTDLRRALESVFDVLSSKEIPALASRPYDGTNLRLWHH